MIGPVPAPGDPAGRLILLTDRRQAHWPLVEVVRAAVAVGVRVVVLREKDLPQPTRRELAARLRAVLAGHGRRLLLAGTEVAADGRHLAANDPWPNVPAEPAGHAGATRSGERCAPTLAGERGALLGRSCHSRAEVAAAAAHGAHYATLSPVFPSASKPGYGPPLGPNAFAPPLPLPVYALGGVDSPERARRCVEAGATGIAVMGAIMRAADPAATTAALLAAVT
jgi:thiamine-phosphate pyrophosphorylase